MNLILHHIEIGERHHDDSGWSRLVRVDTQANEITIDPGNYDAHTPAEVLERLRWLHQAIGQALDVLDVEHRQEIERRMMEFRLEGYTSQCKINAALAGEQVVKATFGAAP